LYISDINAVVNRSLVDSAAGGPKLINITFGFDRAKVAQHREPIAGIRSMAAIDCWLGKDQTMATAPDTQSDRAVDPGRLDIIVQSIGTASLRTAAAVAQGLGVPVEVAVQAIYRAPATLVHGVDPALARKLCALLAEAGLQVATVPAGAPVEAGPLLDVAAWFTDPRAIPATARALHRLAGIDEAAALAMLLTPPGVVLGGVSAATVEALRAALPAGVELGTSTTATARFQLLLADAPAIVERGVMAELAAHGITPLATAGIVAADLDHATAQSIWQRFSRTGAVQMVNQDFLRFAIVIDAPPVWTPAQAALLAARAGVPAAALPNLAGVPAITIETGLLLAAAGDALAAYAEAGLAARADLTSFRHYSLEITAAPNRAALAAQLAANGLAPPQHLPWVTPEALPETRARLVRTLLESVGADAYLVEPAHG
jgi:hypothetical protein